ncbi:hypothetical protein C8R45DRAFT_1103949 [Mycena sanguinolenta]|nr:hypothetical protein C8R45DRAFT_1103949 [Mycena sanguinolenta]
MRMRRLAGSAGGRSSSTGRRALMTPSPAQSKYRVEHLVQRGVSPDTESITSPIEENRTARSRPDRPAVSLASAREKSSLSAARRRTLSVVHICAAGRLSPHKLSTCLDFGPKNTSRLAWRPQSSRERTPVLRLVVRRGVGVPQSPSLQSPPDTTPIRRTLPLTPSISPKIHARAQAIRSLALPLPIALSFAYILDTSRLNNLSFVPRGQRPRRLGNARPYRGVEWTPTSLSLREGRMGGRRFGLSAHDALQCRVELLLGRRAPLSVVESQTETHPQRVLARSRHLATSTPTGTTISSYGGGHSLTALHGGASGGRLHVHPQARVKRLTEVSMHEANRSRRESALGGWAAWWRE